MYYTLDTEPKRLTTEATTQRIAEENVYIAGPECFYVYGNTALEAMKLSCHAQGFDVSLPNDTEIDMTQRNRRRIADDIFYNCARALNESTALICDLELYRGQEPDGGSVFEIGMAYARGLKIIGYTRDLRPDVAHNFLREWGRDEGENVAHETVPYQYLPFGPCLLGSTEIVQGAFQTALEVLVRTRRHQRIALGAGESTNLLGLLVQPTDSCSLFNQSNITPIEKLAASHTKQNPLASLSASTIPTVYYAGPRRYADDACEHYLGLKEDGLNRGWKVLTPIDPLPAEKTEEIGCQPHPHEDPWSWAGRMFTRFVSHVVATDIVIADLSDFRGYEPQQDVSFECGLAFQLNKGLWGHMADTAIMRNRIPNLGADFEFRDNLGAAVENFDYPINLMFASSMPITQGAESDAVKAMTEGAP